ncbi:MAG: hypothetical protein JNL38_17780 [Myxococcales bacterium]|nr:hypothetical protein [Myxococcales bacterium]
MAETIVNLDELWPAVVLGDTGAYARWMSLAEPTIRRSLRGFAIHVDVEAVVQEALLRMWQIAPRFEADGRDNGTLRLGLRVARNLALSEARRMRAELTESEVLEAQGVDAEPTMPDPILRAAILACREALPDKPREALDARLESAGNEDDGAIAERLGQRKNTFLQNFTRARRLLAECLQRRGHGTLTELGA